MRLRYQARLAQVPSDEQESRADHRQLPCLDPHVERHQRGDKFRARQSELLECARETHAVQQPEGEDEGDPPGLQLCKEDVLNGDVRNREGDQGLDDLRRHGNHAVYAQPQRDGMSDGERADLPQDSASATAQQVRCRARTACDPVRGARCG